MRKVLTPERDVLNVLMRRDTPIFSDETVRYFQDIYDHLLRVLDSIDTYRDLLSSALDSYLSVRSNRMNKVMKQLSEGKMPSPEQLMAGAGGGAPRIKRQR